MDKFKKVLDAMESQAIKENKAEDFISFCNHLKKTILIGILAGKYNRAEAEEMRDYIISKEREIKNAFQRI